MKRIRVPFWLTPAALLFTPLGASALTVGQLCNLFLRVKNLFAGVIGTLAVISILYAAFLFLTGGGNEDTQKKAKTFLLYGLIGIAVALFAAVAATSIANLLGTGTELTPGCGGFS